MAPPAIIDEDEEYASSEDSDFAPDNAPIVAESESEDSEGEEPAESTSVKKPKAKPAKRKRGEEEAEDVGYENSGDEEIIGKGLKAKKRKAKKGQDEDDEGGEGGFVRTRAMKALAPEERKPLASTEAATIDVDALWASMTAAPLKPSSTAPPPIQNDLMDIVQTDENKPGADSGLVQPADESDMIMIERTYNFAGQVHKESKLVPRDSAEAKLFLSSQTSSAIPATTETRAPAIQIRRPKARRSIFEPVTEAMPQRTDLRFKVGSYVGAPAGVLTAKEAAAKKLNTVEKSKMDWAGFVDKEGIKDELETAGKKKGTYLDNKEFLARAEDRREEEARKIRLKNL